MTELPRTFILFLPGVADQPEQVVAEGVLVFGHYFVSWIGELPDRRAWDSLDEAIAAHSRQDDGLELRWT